MRKAYFLIPFLIGCGSLGEQSTGVGIGAGGAIIIDKLKEELTPFVPINIKPLEICGLDEGASITCILIPCVITENKTSESCVRKFATVDKFFANVGKVTTLRTSASQRSELVQACKKNKYECIKQIGRYEGETIIIVDSKK